MLANERARPRKRAGTADGITAAAPAGEGQAFEPPRGQATEPQPGVKFTEGRPPGFTEDSEPFEGLGIVSLF